MPRRSPDHLLMPSDDLMVDIFETAARIETEGPVAVLINDKENLTANKAEVVAFAASLGAPDEFLIQAAKFNLIELMCRDHAAHNRVGNLVETLMDWHQQLHSGNEDDENSVPVITDPLLARWVKYHEQYDLYRETTAGLADL